MDERFRSGDALFASDVDMRVVLWNAEAERLVGVSAADAVSHPCWEVVRGVDERGAVVCHRGCAAARLARDGWPVPTRRFLIPSEGGRRLVCAATVAVELDGPEPVVLHVLRSADEDRKSTRLNYSHLGISYADFCLKKKKQYNYDVIHNLIQTYVYDIMTLSV